METLTGSPGRPLGPMSPSSPCKHAETTQEDENVLINRYEIAQCKIYFKILFICTYPLSVLSLRSWRSQWACVTLTRRKRGKIWYTILVLFTTHQHILKHWGYYMNNYEQPILIVWLTLCPLSPGKPGRPSKPRSPWEKITDMWANSTALQKVETLHEWGWYIW